MELLVSHTASTKWMFWFTTCQETAKKFLGKFSISHSILLTSLHSVMFELFCNIVHMSQNQ